MLSIFTTPNAISYYNVGMTILIVYDKVLDTFDEITLDDEDTVNIYALYVTCYMMHDI